MLDAQPPAALLNAIRSTPISVRRLSLSDTIGERIGRVLQGIGLGPSPWPALAGIAAGVLIGFAATEINKLSGGEVLVAERNGTLVAAGGLARTLESATMQASQEEGVRIIATFKDETGRWCRLYQGTAHAGLACRQTAEGWQILAAGEGVAASDGLAVPSGGGGAEAVDDLAYRMMASSAALDIDAEAALIARGWEAQ